MKSGRLKPDSPLPTVRQLAGDLVINRNSVARAYRILEEQGVILTAGRKGTIPVIADRNPQWLAWLTLELRNSRGR